ncbi:capsular polysaccharide transport system permease protein [Brevundimonas vesicularis]|nr:capsular polysaccharide transport system permease protein [Brevundimonas vesicularis]
MREIMTRYGREGLGFAWLVGEPLIFCFGVIVMWSVLKPPYEHGIKVGSFVMTGYMCLILMRHVISFNIGAIQANIGLLYHRHITVVHLIISRDILELAGATVAFFVVYLSMYMIGQTEPPKDYLLLMYGWFLLFLLSTALGMILSALSAEFELLERVVPLVQYMLIPVSGVFTMLAWIPHAYRDTFLLIPLPHAVEMVRAGVFGEFVETHYDMLYPLAWSGVLNVIGLLMLARAKQHVDVE